jgi:hypothetical protein
MNHTRNLLVAVGILAIGSAVGCSVAADPPSSSASESIITTTPQIAAPVEPAPTQFSQGRNAVEFDPCLKIDDPTISRAGFDPGTRERSDFTFDSYSFIGCDFDDVGMSDGIEVPLRTLTIWSSNIALDEYRTRYAENIDYLTIAGRAAIHYRNPRVNAESCSLAIQSTDGVLDITKYASAAFGTEKPCEGINEIAETIVSAIPD